MAERVLNMSQDDKRFKPGVTKPFVGDLGVRQGFVDAVSVLPQEVGGRSIQAAKSRGSAARVIEELNSLPELRTDA
jgi:hypothetical protein